MEDSANGRKERETWKKVQRIRESRMNERSKEMCEESGRKKKSVPRYKKKYSSDSDEPSRLRLSPQHRLGLKAQTEKRSKERMESRLKL